MEIFAAQQDIKKKAFRNHILCFKVGCSAPFQLYISCTPLE